MSAFIQTYTGGQFFPFDPKPEDVDIRDIAHALAMTCRFGGHCKQFYSVAQHSVLMYRAASTPSKVRALMHDAAEAYIGDMPRPIKHDEKCRVFGMIESRIEQAICEHFGLPFQIVNAEVKDLDNRILIDEREQIMAPVAYEGGWPDVKPLGVTIEQWSPERARWEFLDAWDECQVLNGRLFSDGEMEAIAG